MKKNIKKIIIKLNSLIIIILFIMLTPKIELANNETEFFLGDINNDKTIDSKDLLLILRHVYSSENGKKQEWILTGNNFLAGDLTKNGKIDSSDTIAILRHIAASESEEISKRHKDWLITQKIEINVDSINLNKEKLELSIGEIEELIVTVLPKDATNKKVTWSTSNEKVATVDDNGKVTAKGEGETTITAKTENGKEAKCTVKVKTPEILATNIKLNKTTLELEKGKSEKLIATIEPSNTTNKEVTWISSNGNIATVDGEGKVTAKGEGEAIITAKTLNGKEAKCTVKVKIPEILATNIKLNKTTLELEKGKSEKLIATIEPSNATNKVITWTSSNSSVATVNNDGTVTIIAEGETTITAKTSNGKTASCTVTVGRKTSGGKIVLKDYNVIDTSIPVFIGGHKYTDLTEIQKKQIAYLAYLEQGTPEGAKVELSLMANLTEDRRSDYDIYDYVMNSGWFGPVDEIPYNPEFDWDFTEEFVELVEMILVNGERYLPTNICEHDCFSDISSISTGSVYDESDYIPNETVIYNDFGAIYVFVGFAPNGGDPFGYLIN